MNFVYKFNVFRYIYVFDELFTNLMCLISRRTIYRNIEPYYTTMVEIKSISTM